MRFRDQPPELPAWLTWVALAELLLVIGPLSVYSLFVVPMGVLTALQDAELWLCGIGAVLGAFGLATAWVVVSRVAWAASGAFVLSTWQVCGILSGLLASILMAAGVVPFAPPRFFVVPPAILGVAHLLLAGVKRRALCKSA